MSDDEAAEAVRALDIDILIDLTGHTQDTRIGILARRPAPIQVNLLGYPGTLGGDFIDYIVADGVVLPFDHQPFYTEKIVHLPDCFQPNDAKRSVAIRTRTRAEAGLPDDGFVFCCFNNHYKITAPVFDIWMRLLREVEGSLLWLSQSNEAVVANLRRESQARGVDPARVIFAPRLERYEDHLARLADLFLDTLPYNAHTTASDALWAGLPVLTQIGASFAGRVAASLNEAVGLPELVTTSAAEYENLALRLARDPVLLRGYRERLARNRASWPLFDSERYRRHIEAAYTQMWETWQRGEAPQSFAVEHQAR
jgi:protein O-GlcNAc transferase